MVDVMGSDNNMATIAGFRVRSWGRFNGNKKTAAMVAHGDGHSQPERMSL